MQSLAKNEASMHGGGVYSNHSAIQYAAMKEALSLFPKELIGSSTGLTLHDPRTVTLIIYADWSFNETAGPAQQNVPYNFLAVDYGSAQGSNSVLPFTLVLSALPENANASIIFNDKPSNDWDGLAHTIAHLKQNLDATEKKSCSVFPAMVSLSFYDQVVPDRSVDLGFSLSSLNHLDHQTDEKSSSDQQTPDLGPASLRDSSQLSVSATARRDLLRFLSSRAREIKSGGPLILNFVIRNSDPTIPNIAPLLKAMNGAFRALRQENRISDAFLAAYKLSSSAVYSHSLDELTELLGLATVEMDWAVEVCYPKIIPHPAVETLKEAKNGALREQQSDEIMEGLSSSYANAVVDWVMAAAPGYFLSALRASDHQSTKGNKFSEDEQRLFAEYRQKTLDIFLRESSDEPVFCNYVFLRLRRR